MLDAGLFFLYPDGFMNHTLLDADALQQPLLSDLVYESTATKDGFITISAGTPMQRAGVHKALGRDDLNTDPRFATMESLVANLEVYRAEMASAFLQFDSDTMVQRLNDNEVPCAKFLSLDEVVASPQIEACGTLKEIDHPTMGRMRVVANPAKFGGQRLPDASPSPGHGEHTQAILTEMGVAPGQLAELTQAGVVA